MILPYVIIIAMKDDPITPEAIDANIEAYIQVITKEFKNGFDFIKKYPKTVSIFGSARLTPASSHYGDAKRLASRIVKDLGYSIVTGGGPGIMEASNLGAKEAQGTSLGIEIELPHEQHTNEYVMDSAHFNYFFTRKTMLTFSAKAFVFFPGGFGTLDELFSILTLLQTGKIPSVPVVLFGKDFWKPLVDCMETHLLKQHHAINEDDFKLFTVTDSVDTTLKIIREAPAREWWKSM